MQCIACGQWTDKQLESPKSACFTGFLNNKATLLPIQALYQKQSGNMVEARGVEPLSENPLTGPSPSAANVLGFPRYSPHSQGQYVGSFIRSRPAQSLTELVPRLFLTPRSALSGRRRWDAHGFRPRGRIRYCLRLFFCLSFIAVSDSCGSLIQPPKILVETRYAPMSTAKSRYQ